jgi:hypothetical protein
MTRRNTARIEQREEKQRVCVYVYSLSPDSSVRSTREPFSFTCLGLFSLWMLLPFTPRVAPSSVSSFLLAAALVLLWVTLHSAKSLELLFRELLLLLLLLLLLCKVLEITTGLEPLLFVMGCADADTDGWRLSLEEGDEDSDSTSFAATLSALEQVPLGNGVFLTGFAAVMAVGRGSL